MLFRYLLVLLLCLTTCGSPSPTEIRDEGQRRVLLLTNTLRKIKTREQLISSQELLKTHFDELVDLMIQAQESRLKYPDTEPMPPLLDDHINIELQAQLQRVCRLMGGLEILEKCQEASLNRLDRYEKEKLNNSKR